LGRKGRYVYRVELEARFEAAHQLRTLLGAGSAAEPVEPLHGHGWRVRAVLETEELDADGIAVEFGRARAALERLAARFDHRNINELPPFDRLNPTTEALARYFLEELGTELARPGAAAGGGGGGRALVREVAVAEGAGGVATCRLREAE